MKITVEEMYGTEYGDEDPQLEALLAQSLNPRDTNLYYKKFGELGVKANDLVLDVGCRDAKHTLRFIEHFSCRAIGFDPVPNNLQRAKKNIAASQHEKAISIFYGKSEYIPLPNQIIDHIWCRDVLSHTQLSPTLENCNRVLKPGGKMLVYQTFATAWCEPNEAHRLYDAFAIVPENMSTAFFEETAVSSGFQLIEKDVVGSEWRENWLENGDDSMCKDMLTIARLRRNQDALIKQFGKKRYEITLADSLWGIYQMLGKLEPTIYVLQKPS